MIRFIGLSHLRTQTMEALLTPPLEEILANMYSYAYFYFNYYFDTTVSEANSWITGYYSSNIISQLLYNADFTPMDPLLVNPESKFRLDSLNEYG